MNAPFAASPGGAYPASPVPRAVPRADADYVSVAVDGRRFRVFYAGGRPYWVSRELRDGVVLAGVPLDQCVAGCLHAEAARVAGSLLAGLRQGAVARMAERVPA